ncbi:GD17533 [Drosophila simulans]|uniref:GD17533 n=1 Tax=Drosophila simulans TaxID=7240 RepID=B4R3R7_DROSI|nr:GD17533 [Drosophila simulans]
MINGLSVGGGQQVAQVTPTGAAIKLHFAYNNNSNISSSSNISDNNYSGLKTAETKMRNNQNYTGRALKIVEKIPRASGVIAATSGNQGAKSLVGYSPAAASYVSGLSRDILISRELSQRSGDFLTAAAKMVSQMGASELRWLPIPRTKDKPSSAGGAEAKTSVRESESHESPGKAAKSALGDPQPQRTEDQENAFRRIEDVHNYAKLQDCSSDTDDEDDEEEDLDEEEDDEEEAEIQVQLPVQLRSRAFVARPPKSMWTWTWSHAITKILGDWWAALDEQEKHCFTDLAQQNKDSFFNANPNFKWYKLPAPPLRTLATRPSNATAGLLIPSEDQPQQQVPTSLQVQWAERGEMPRAMLRPNYFKLADETQMGELSSLLQVQVQEKDFALQQVLSETSQFLSAHMPAGNTNGNGNKRSLQDNNSSNSSEEEAASGSPQNKKVKSSRSCKGKIYQELVNSGQLAAIAKKSKARLPPAGSMGGNFVDIPLDAGPNTPPVSPPERQGSSPDSMQKHMRSVSESSSSGFFDLEEKIKELPALSLDAYLQRKRSTKKKKKFSGTKKQRNSNSTSGASAASNVAAADAAAKGAVPLSSEQHVRIKQQQLQAVGSQRRKARKESITRRDVSAIEQEVASILPLTINGSYYFNQSGAPKAVNASVTSSSASPPLSSNSSSSSSSLSSQTAFDVTSSTSDLLILAEVAANRIELTKSN